MRHLALLGVVVLAIGCGDDVRDVGAVGGMTTTTAVEAPRSLDSDDFPGERLDFFPHEGAALAVVGVAVGDTLNVHAGPGVDFGLVVELDPMATGLIATGHNRSIGDARWAEVSSDVWTGWVDTAHLAHLGAVDDITADVAPPGQGPPRAGTMVELADQVAGRFVAGETPDHELTVVIVHSPTLREPAEVVVDVLGYGDDAALGVRLHVFGEPTADGEGYTLRGAESTALCRRGASVDGYCT